jgi:hypothetical protein
MNPVRARLCSSPADWQWSSFSDTVGLRGRDSLSSKKVLGFFGTDPDRAREIFRRFVKKARPADGLAPKDTRV